MHSLHHDASSWRLRPITAAPPAPPPPDVAVIHIERFYTLCLLGARASDMNLEGFSHSIRYRVDTLIGSSGCVSRYRCPSWLHPETMPAWFTQEIIYRLNPLATAGTPLWQLRIFFDSTYTLCTHIIPKVWAALSICILYLCVRMCGAWEFARQLCRHCLYTSGGR